LRSSRSVKLAVIAVAVKWAWLALDDAIDDVGPAACKLTAFTMQHVTLGSAGAVGVVRQR